MPSPDNIVELLDDETPSSLMELLEDDSSASDVVPTWSLQGDDGSWSYFNKQGQKIKGPIAVAWNILWDISGGEIQGRRGTVLNVDDMCTALGIDRRQPLDTIKKQFRKALVVFHPDRLRLLGMDEASAHAIGWRLNLLKEQLGI